MYSIIDIETTGQKIESAKITDIAIFIHDGKKIVRRFCSLINPECKISTSISQLTGITDSMVQNAPKFEDLATTIEEMTTGCIFVAHNVSFDYGIIKEEFKRIGKLFQRDTLCTVKLSRKYFPGYHSYSLGKLCEVLNIEIRNRHRAEGDALATVELFEKILNQHDHPGGKEIQQKLF